MKYYTLGGLLCLNIIVRAQSVSTIMGARAASMGNASAALNDEAALFNNVGAMAEIRNTSSFFSCEARPALPGANRMAAGIYLPTKFGTGGFGVFRFGDDLYNEQVLSAGFSNKFGIASLGAKVNYIQYHAESFGTKNAVSINFGGLARITPQISIGAYIVNINQSKISEDERLPTKLTAGLGFKPDSHFFIATEVEKDLDYDATWRLGAEYVIHKKVFVRTGFNLNPSVGYAGLGIKNKRLSFDYALSFSHALGLAHQGSAAYRLGRHKNEE